MKAKFPLLVISSMTALALSLGACSGGGATPSETSATPQSAEASRASTEAQPMSSSSATEFDSTGGGAAQPSSEFADKILVNEHAGIVLTAVTEFPELGGIQQGAEIEPAECKLTDAPTPLAASSGAGGTLVGSVTLFEGSFASMFKEHVTKCPTMKVNVAGVSSDQTQELAEATVEGAEEVFAVNLRSETTVGEQKIEQRTHYLVGVVSGTSIVILLAGLDGDATPDTEVAKQLFEAQRDLLNS